MRYIVGRKLKNKPQQNENNQGVPKPDYNGFKGQVVTRKVKEYAGMLPANDKVTNDPYFFKVYRTILLPVWKYDGKTWVKP